MGALANVFDEVVLGTERKLLVAPWMAAVETPEGKPASTS